MGAARYLFHEAGEADLVRLTQSRALFAFDFDGTLAPIEPLPDRVRTPASIYRLLRQLGEVAPVAVVSGRRRADLVGRLPDTVRYQVGNHGNEGASVDVDPAELAAVCAAWMGQLGPLLAERPGEVAVEDKTLSLSLHYRLARDRRAAQAWIESILPRLHPAPRVIGGKLVFNLLPPTALTKLEALRAIAAAEGVRDVLFVGDDDTDELVFAAAPPGWLTIRVELKRDSAARYFVHQQADVARLLDWLVHRTILQAACHLDRGSA